MLGDCLEVIEEVNSSIFSSKNLPKKERSGTLRYSIFFPENTNKGEEKNKTPLDESNRKLTKADFANLTYLFSDKL